MKFKVGDKVKTRHGYGVIMFFDKSDETYLVKVQGFKGHRGSSGYINEDSESDKWWFYEGDLELINQDLRELLQVGYKVDFGDYCALIDDYKELDGLIAIRDSRLDLKPKYKWSFLTINAIYRPKYNGLKPMEWVLVWEREEELFTLQCPITEEYLCKVDIGGISWDVVYNLRSQASTSFTQQEIDNLPNQELIKVLVKKEIKGN